MFAEYEPLQNANYNQSESEYSEEKIAYVLCYSIMVSLVPVGILGVEFISRRENISTSGPMGRLFVTLISSIAELESDLIKERVRAGMRRARLEGRQIGRTRLDVDRQQVIIDRESGMSLTQTARKYSISRASVCRISKEQSLLPSATPAEVACQ